VFPKEMLLALGEVLRAHPRVMVLSDDIYAPLNYTGEPHATLANLCPDLADRICTVSGVSKSHAMTGFRIGVATGPEWLVKAMGRLQSHASGNPCSISQAAAVAAINAIPGLSTPVPDGAFYCFVDAAPLMERFGDDETLALHLLEHGVAVVAASAFGGRDGFRISFATDDALLEEAMRRIAACLT
jgi:aspartate aminotransferase